LVAILVVGILLYLVEHYLPMENTVKRIFIFVVIVLVLLWLLGVSGVLPTLRLR
jgi:hypothetical protein